MSAFGSAQLRQYLRARRNGTPTEAAAAQCGFTLAEARLTDADEAKGALSHIDDRLPHPDFEHSTAPADGTADQRASVNGGGDEAHVVPPMISPGAHHTKEPAMARTARKPKLEQVEQVHKPDFELAVRIYRGDIKPAQSKVGEHAQELSTAYKEIKKTAHIQPQAAKLAFKLDDMEEAKRDDFLRSLNGLLKRLNIFMPSDLVDAAQGEATGDVIPSGEPRRLQLATVPSGPIGDTDLADDEPLQAA